ncbi:hypothetical protein MBLNU13_g05295t1 [Cladosporium sp. NU13]
MHNAQRILLAVSCLSCFAFLKYCWTADMLTGELLVQRHGRLHVDSDGFVTCDRATDTPVNHIQQAPTLPVNHETHCADLDGIDDLAIILKTGSTEIYEKLPIHFTTTFLCVKDRLIYSDVQQYFSGESVRDALVLVSQESRNKHDDLQQHTLLNEHVRLSGDAAELRGEKSWHIDKWKFLPMISDAYAAFGVKKKWYFFIEADTYVSLHNLLPWLAMLDHKQAIYAGAQVMIDQTEFGHGGSGFLLSSSAAKALSDVYHSDKKHWESVIAADCCGDKVMAEVLQAADPPVRLLRTFPQIQGETLSSLDWSATHWCRPAMTWHHVNAAGIDKLWQFDLRCRMVWHGIQGQQRLEQQTKDTLSTLEKPNADSTEPASQPPATNPAKMSPGDPPHASITLTHLPKSHADTTHAALEKPPPTQSPTANVLVPETSRAAEGPVLLLVDDNRVNLQLLMAFAKKNKYRYISAQDGKIALDAFETAHRNSLESPAPDKATIEIPEVILMDINMPVMDGYEAVQRIRAYESKHQMTPAKIIAITALQSEAAQTEAFGSGFDMFLSKPIKLKSLAKVLQNG